MMRLTKFLLGLGLGAAIALLFAPKSGRELRQQLVGGASRVLLPAPPEYPEPQGERTWEAPATTSVTEPPPVEPVVAEDSFAVEDVAVEEVAVVEEVSVVAEDVAVEEPPPAVPPDEPEDVGVAVEESGGAAGVTSADDLRARIDETRADVESDIAQRFGPAAPPVPLSPVPEPPPWESPATEALEAEEERAATDEAVGVDVPALEAEPPVAEAPVEEPPSGEPAAREPGSVDQAEMRRRIEETRARLKAKAFDAMMSGEAALLARDGGETPAPRDDGAELDGDVESTIDESLSPEEY